MVDNKIQFTLEALPDTRGVEAMRAAYAKLEQEISRINAKATQGLQAHQMGNAWAIASRKPGFDVKAQGSDWLDPVTAGVSAGKVESAWSGAFGKIANQLKPLKGALAEMPVIGGLARMAMSPYAALGIAIAVTIQKVREWREEVYQANEAVRRAGDTSESWGRMRVFINQAKLAAADFLGQLDKIVNRLATATENAERLKAAQSAGQQAEKDALDKQKQDELSALDASNLPEWVKRKRRGQIESKYEQQQREMEERQARENLQREQSTRDKEFQASEAAKTAALGEMEKLPELQARQAEEQRKLGMAREDKEQKLPDLRRKLAKAKEDVSSMQVNPFLYLLGDQGREKKIAPYQEKVKGIEDEIDRIIRSEVNATVNANAADASVRKQEGKISGLTGEATSALERSRAAQNAADATSAGIYARDMVPLAARGNSEAQAKLRNLSRTGDSFGQPNEMRDMVGYLKLLEKIEANTRANPSTLTTPALRNK